MMAPRLEILVQLDEVFFCWWWKSFANCLRHDVVIGLVEKNPQSKINRRQGQATFWLGQGHSSMSRVEALAQLV
jgi:hypothetical protein